MLVNKRQTTAREVWMIVLNVMGSKGLKPLIYLNKNNHVQRPGKAKNCCGNKS